MLYQIRFIHSSGGNEFESLARKDKQELVSSNRLREIMRIVIGWKKNAFPNENLYLNKITTGRYLFKINI